MREILFRGKRIDNGEWIGGSAINIQYDVRGDKHTYIGVSVMSERYPLMKTIDWHEVDPETVGQYTGVTDKNGKKIFEGDIVKVYSATGELDSKKAVIFWDELFSQWKANKSALFGSNICATYEIIGNIHDNPELLKGGAE